jgi:hypothetical protein
LKQIKSVGTEIENQLTLVDPSAVVREDPESALTRPWFPRIVWPSTVNQSQTSMTAVPAPDFHLEFRDVSLVPIAVTGTIKKQTAKKNESKQGMRRV